MIDLVLENDDQVFVQPLVNEDPDHVPRHAEAPAHAGDVLGFGRPRLPGDGVRRCRPTC